MKKEDINDEICECGHSKGYHKAHTLDAHGGGCEKCDCKLYTWKGFVKYLRFWIGFATGMSILIGTLAGCYSAGYLII